MAQKRLTATHQPLTNLTPIFCNANKSNESFNGKDEHKIQCKISLHVIAE